MRTAGSRSRCSGGPAGVGLALAMVTAALVQTAAWGQTFSVPVRWCVVADDANGNGVFDAGEGGPPAFTNPGNVGEPDTDNVLWRRHERATDNIYLPQANVTLRSALYNIVEDATLRFPIIPDQDLSAGQAGDVIDKSIDADEWNATYNACVQAWRDDHGVEDIGIVAVVARKIVDTAGVPTGVFGWGPFAMRRLLVEDNAFSLPGSSLTDSAVLDPVDKLVGHEVGHTLADLRHVASTAGGGQDDNLMRQGRQDLDGDSLLDNFQLSSSVTDVTGATVDQITAIRTAAQAAPGCKIAGTNTDCSSMGDVRADAVKDVADRVVDISMLFVTEAAGMTKFAHELFGIFTDASFERFVSLEYFVLVDLDNDASTGGAPAVLGIPTTFTGAELVTRVQVFPFIIESPAHVVTVPKIWEFQAGSFVEVADPSIRARVDETVSPIHNGGAAIEVHTSDAVVIEFSNAIRGPVSLPFRLQALAVGTPAKGNPVVDRLDDAPPELGRLFRLRSPTFPVVSVAPDPVAAGGLARAQATGLLPNAPVHLVLGDQEVAVGIADAAGATTLDFMIPVDARPGRRLVTVGTVGTGLTADGVVEVVIIAPTAVAVDIKPQSCRNPLRVGARGVLPVAIVGTAGFDVRQVEPNSLRLEGVTPLRSSVEDVATPFFPFTGKRGPFDCTDEGADGFADLTLKFDSQQVAAALGPVADGQVRVLRVTGALRPEFGGTPIIGEDVVVILNKNEPDDVSGRSQRDSGRKRTP